MIESLVPPNGGFHAARLALARIHALRERVAVLRSSTDVLSVKTRSGGACRAGPSEYPGYRGLDRRSNALLDAAAALDGATLVAPNVPESEACAAAPPRRQSVSAYTAGPSGFRKHGPVQLSAALPCLRRTRWRRSRVARGVGTCARYPSVACQCRMRVRTARRIGPYGVRRAVPVRPARGSADRGVGGAVARGSETVGSGHAVSATCHLPGVHGRIARAGDTGAQWHHRRQSRPARHTPTLLNAALQPALLEVTSGRGRGGRRSRRCWRTPKRNGELDGYPRCGGWRRTPWAAFRRSVWRPPERAARRPSRGAGELRALARRAQLAVQ